MPTGIIIPGITQTVKRKVKGPLSSLMETNTSENSKTTKDTVKGK